MALVCWRDGFIGTLIDFYFFIGIVFLIYFLFTSSEGLSPASDTDFALLEPHLADAFSSDAVWTARLGQSLTSSPSEQLPNDTDANEVARSIPSGNLDADESHAPIARMSTDQSEHADMLDESDDASDSGAYFAVSSSNQNA